MRDRGKKIIIQHAAQQPARFHLQREREREPCHEMQFVPTLTPVLCPAPGLVEISTVERGVVSLFGVRSELFVAMNSRGRLYGTVGMHSISFLS